MLFPTSARAAVLYPREVPIHVRSLGSTSEVSVDTGEPRQAGPGRRSGADLSASGRGGASRSPCPRHFGAERPSKSFGIYFDSRRTYWFERMAARSYGQTTTVARWAFDFAGGTKPAKPSGPGFLRGALPGRVLFPCWCGRSGGAPASASASTFNDDCYGWPIGVSHDRTAPRVGKRGAACFGGRSPRRKSGRRRREGYPDRKIAHGARRPRRPRIRGVSGSDRPSLRILSFSVHSFPNERQTILSPHRERPLRARNTAFRHLKTIISLFSHLAVFSAARRSVRVPRLEPHVLGRSQSRASAKPPRGRPSPRHLRHAQMRSHTRSSRRRRRSWRTR